MALETTSVPANEVRMPTPDKGIAFKVLRYKTEQSVILHPDDYTALVSFADFIEEASALEPLGITDAAREAYEDVEQPTGPIEDREELLKLFGA